MPMTDGNLLTA